MVVGEVKGARRLWLGRWEGQRGVDDDKTIGAVLTM